MWPSTADDLVAEQERLARATPAPWVPRAGDVVAACFVCSARGKGGPGARGDPAWAAAATRTDASVVSGTAGAPYEAGLLALREGPLLEAAVRGLTRQPDVLLVDATGRDHPRRAGLALHLGAVLELPTIGVTHRTLLAEGEWPADERGARNALMLDGEVIGFWLRTRAGTRPLAVHAGWRTDPATAAEIVLACSRRRTPEPVRRARSLARTARAREDVRVSDFALTSSAFEDGQPVPQRHTCEGDDVSPPLAWSGVPDGTRSLVLVVDDPDAPRGTFTHWLAWGLDLAAGALREGERAPLEGRNDFGEPGYRGPCPPPGHGPHRYFFRLHALDAELVLEAGADRKQLERALGDHVLAVTELVGTYERS